MNLHRAVRTLALVMVFACGASDSLIGESVNQSRFKLTNASLSGGATVTVPMEMLNELCRDEDGCAFSLRYENGAEFRASSWRLFLSAGTRWASSYENAAKDDGDGGDSTAGLVSAIAGGCRLTDGNGADPGVGFDLVLSSGPFASNCVLVLID
jgi:hypothetical protein